MSQDAPTVILRVSSICPLNSKWKTLMICHHHYLKSLQLILYLILISSLCEHISALILLSTKQHFMPFTTLVRRTSLCLMYSETLSISAGSSVQLLIEPYKLLPDSIPYALSPWSFTISRTMIFRSDFSLEPQIYFHVPPGVSHFDMSTPKPTTLPFLALFCCLPSPHC